MSKIKVTGLELTTADGKKVALTLDEARDFYTQLDALFGKPTFTPTPIFIDRYPQPWYPYHPTWTYLSNDSQSASGITCKLGQNSSVQYLAASES